MLLLLCAVLLILGTGITQVIAYQTDSGERQNAFSPGYNDSEITEEYPPPDPINPGENRTIVKKVAVTNQASVPCYVRVALKASNSDLPITYMFGGQDGYNKSDWELKDGYYYYKHVLNVQNRTSYLIDSVRVNGDQADTTYLNKTEQVSIFVYAETVQAKNADTGELWSSYQEAWDHYHNPTS